MSLGSRLFGEHRARDREEILLGRVWTEEETLDDPARVLLLEPANGEVPDDTLREWVVSHSAEYLA